MVGRGIYLLSLVLQYCEAFQKFPFPSVLPLEAPQWVVIYEIVLGQLRKSMTFAFSTDVKSKFPSTAFPGNFFGSASFGFCQLE